MFDMKNTRRSEDWESLLSWFTNRKDALLKQGSCMLFLSAIRLRIYINHLIHPLFLLLMHFISLSLSYLAIEAFTHSKSVQ